MCSNSINSSVETPNSFKMDRRGSSESFMYDLSTPPKNSTRNNSRVLQQESKHDRAKRKNDEWTHDAHPPATSSYFPSLDSPDSRVKKTRTKHTQETVSISQEEVVPCSIDVNPGDSQRLQRFSNRLVDKSIKRGVDSGSSKDSIEFAVRMLDINIHQNKERIEAIKERRSGWMKRIKEFNDLIHLDDVEIRAAERANMQMESQKEKFRAHIFSHAYRV